MVLCRKIVMNAPNRVIVNTSAQFAKTFVSGIITLYSSRVILASLGENDFGIYSLVAGIIAMLAFITNALSSTTQRFISYYQCQQDLKKIFSNSVFLHLGLGLLAFLVFASLIPWLFNGFLNISPDRLSAAKFVYFTVIFTLLVTFITSPFKAVLIAHENIVFVSVIDTLDAVLKLAIALTLNYAFMDKLMYYGLMLLGIQFFNFFLISLYAFKHYDECCIPRISYFSKDYLKKLTSFASWNVYSLGCTLGRTQGLAIVLNKFLGTVANAAYGIGIQISSYVNYMSESLLNAIRPQIVKAEGEGLRERVFNLSVVASKFSFFLLSWLSIPCIFEMPKLLQLWLGNPPEGSVLFCRMFLLAGLVDSITIGLHIANQAIGNLKVFALIINTSKLLVLPISIIGLICGLDATCVAVAYVGMELLTALARIAILKKDGLTVSLYLKGVFAKLTFPLLICLIVNTLCITHICSVVRIIYTFVISFTIYPISIYMFGMTDSEKNKINNLIKGMISKV